MTASKWSLDVVKLAKALLAVVGGQVFAHPIVVFGQGLALLALGASLDNALLSFGGWFLFVLIPFYYIAAVRQIRRQEDIVIRNLTEEPWDAQARIPGLIRSIESIGTFQVIVTAIAIVLTLIGVWLEIGIAVAAVAFGFFILTLLAWGVNVRRFSGAKR